MDDAPQAPREPAGAPSADRKLAAFALVLALLWVGLAFRTQLHAAQRTCPASAKGAACVPLLRPRVAAIGPVSASQIALVGAVFAVGVCGLLAMGKAPSALIRGGPALLAAGGGFAIGLQALPLGLDSPWCPLCLSVVGVSNGVALLAVLAARKAAGGATASVAFAVVLVLTAPTAFWRGQALRTDDAARRAAVEAVGGETGPKLVMATRPGCPFCEAMLLDALGDPGVLDLLVRTRGVRQVREFMPEVKQHMQVPMVPALLLVSSEGVLIGAPLVGLKDSETVRAWLEQGLATGIR